MSAPLSLRGSRPRWHTRNVDKPALSGLYIRSLGQGRSTLLMVHGGPEWDHSYLVPAAERLASGRRVVLFDLRGCGRSFRCDRVEDYTRRAAAADVVAVARSLEPPIDLLGFSFGGRLALLAAQMQPRLFRSLILASTSTRGHVTWDPEPAERARRRRAVEDELSRLGPAERAERTRRLALASLPLDVGDEEAIPRVRPAIEAIRFSDAWWQAYEGGGLASEAPIDASWLADSPLPVLVVHGERDYRFPADDSAWLAGAPAVERALIEGAGHLAHLEAPERWNDAVASFLARLD